MQLVSKISNLCDQNPATSQTDGQTDGRATCDRKTALSPLCTKVHCAVKKKQQLPAVWIEIHSGSARFPCNKKLSFSAVSIKCSSNVTFQFHTYMIYAVYHVYMKYYTPYKFLTSVRLFTCYIGAVRPTKESSRPI